MREIVVYVEGGGDTVDQRRKLRQGFDRLFADSKARGSRNECSLRFVCSGSRRETYENFRAALRMNPSRVNALLVDAEAPVTGRTATDRVAHLAGRDRWDLAGIDPDVIHLMVQCMEAWIVADAGALAGYFGKGFRAGVLPGRPNLEEEPKQDLCVKLARATRAARSRSEYRKGRHSGELMQRLDPARIAERCPHFVSFSEWLGAAVRGT